MDIAALVAGANEMTNLVHQRIICAGTGMVHDCEGIVFLGADAGRLPATIGIIDDENANVAR